PAWLPARSRRLPAGASDRCGPLAGWLRACLLEAEPLWRLDGPVGLTHGDYFADNLVVGDGGRLGVLGWGHAGRDLLVLDVGMAIVGLCRDGTELQPERVAPLLAGYGEARRLSAAERAALWPATVHAAAVIAYTRYLRRHVTFPDYREMPAFVESCRRRWHRAALP